MLNLENKIEEFKDHGLDLIIKKETPMQILNLTLQEQHRILEGLFFENDDYAD
jgi:penicillin-binding protein-related factor A (putative recombinase)